MLIDTARPEAGIVSENAVSEEQPETQRTHLRSKTQLNFFSGLFAGAAISSLIPWSTLSDVAPSVRFGILALLCASFVLFRLLTSNRMVKSIMALVLVSLGGFLMSAGPHFAAKELYLPAISVGAVSFLCGIALLLRQRTVPWEVRKQTVKRLIEKPDPPELTESAISRREAMARFEEPVLG
jgi:hypothetical protein